MPISLRRKDERRAVLLALLKKLTEADASASSGDLDDTETAIQELGEAFDAYSNQSREEIEEHSSDTPTAEARLAILQTLSKLLAAMDQSLSKGDLSTVKAALAQARAAVKVTAALEQERRSSGVRRRLPDPSDE
jgi:hypothetical protein